MVQTMGCVFIQELRISETKILSNLVLIQKAQIALAFQFFG